MLLLLGLLRPSGAEAQIDIPDLADINVPYAHYYGTGTYRIGGQRTTVLSLKGRFSLKPFHPGRVGFVIRASGSVAWQQLAAPADSSITFPFFTIAPGLGLDIPLGHRVLLQPFVDAGVVRDIRSDRWMGLGTIGSELEWVITWKEFEIGLEPAAAYSRTFSSDPFADDELLAAFLMLDVRHPLGIQLAGGQADLGAYALYSHFWGDTDFSATVSTTVEIERQLELGVSFGAYPRPKIWVFRTPRLSIGYRFGTGFRGLRIGFGDRRLRVAPPGPP